MEMTTIMKVKLKVKGKVEGMRYLLFSSKYEECGNREWNRAGSMVRGNNSG